MLIYINPASKIKSNYKFKIYANFIVTKFK